MCWFNLSFQSTMGDNRVVRRSTFGQVISSIDCDRCRKTFHEIRALRRHQRDTHGPRINCRYCGADFARARKYDLEGKFRSTSYRATGRFRIQGENRSDQIQTEIVPHRQLAENKSPRRQMIEEVGHQGGPGPPRGQTTSPTAPSERIERQIYSEWYMYIYLLISYEHSILPVHCNVVQPNLSQVFLPYFLVHYLCCLELFLLPGPRLSLCTQEMAHQSYCN